MDRFIAILREEIDLSVKEIEQLAANSCNHAFALSEIYADALNKLKEYILSYSFRNEQEEIRFFKEIKPWFLSRQMFHRKMYYLEIGRPVGNKEEQSAYIEREMSILREYAVRYSDFRCYYRSGDTCLDGVYFTRGRRHDVVYYTEFFEMERDPEFSTLCVFRLRCSSRVRWYWRIWNERLPHRLWKMMIQTIRSVGRALKPDLPK